MDRRQLLKLVGASSIAVGTPILASSNVEATNSTQNQYFNGFKDLSVGSEPPKFRNVYTESDQDLQIEITERTRREVNGTEKSLRLQKEGAGKTGILWTDIPNNIDYELFCVWRDERESEWTNRLELLARASDSGVGVVGGSSQSSIARIAQYNPEFNELGRHEDSQIKPGSEIAQRLRLVDDQVWIRVWEWGNREPRGWTVGPVSTDVALEGGIGMFTYGSERENTDIVVWELSVATPMDSDNWASPRDPDLDFMSLPVEITYPVAANERDIWATDGWDEYRDGDARVHRSVDIYEQWGDDGTVQDLPRDENESGYPVAGAKVYAAYGGTIRDWMQGHPDSHEISPGSGGGYTIHVDSHDDSLMFGYLHMGIDERGAHQEAFAPHPNEDRTLGPGDTVERGQHIGWLGDSGVSGSGPHLHFEIRDTAGQLSDPQPSDFDQIGFAAGPRYDPYPALRDAERRSDYPVDGSDSTEPETRSDCKGSGWKEYGFRNQGQCIRYVNTGKDSRRRTKD